MGLVVVNNCDKRKVMKALIKSQKADLAFHRIQKFSLF